VIDIIPLARIAPAAIESLLDDSFGADRKGRTAYKLREGVGMIPELSFAALDGERLVGSLQSWPVEVAGFALTLVGPVAVAPDRQRAGIGRMLMAALDLAAGTAPLMMIGDAEYYGRFFGFSAEATAKWGLPGPFERHRLLARHVPLGLEGMVGPDLSVFAL
jgi:predicted N-acetyltransferase YhbS